MNVPKLRFKDDDGREFPEWVEKRLADVGENIIGLTYSPSNVTNDDSFPLVLRSSNIKNDMLDLNDQVRVKEKIAEKLFTQKNDILICTRNGSQRLIGKNVLISDVEIPMTFGAFMSVFRSPLNKFIVHLFKTENYNEQIQMNLGARINQITTKNLNAFKFNFPSLPEQTKIANFLKAVDEKISQLTKKAGLLTQYKKGVMRKIFSQELRFKGDAGREFPEWKEHFLGDIATFFNGRAYKQTEWEDHGTPVIRLQNLTGSGDKYYYSNIKLPENQYCNKGDLLYMWSATFGPVWWQGEKAIYHYHIWKIETNENSLTKNYLFYVLDDITAKMKRTSNGSTMDHITKGGMEKLSVILPTIGEQTKIANFLIAIDDKITQNQAELYAVKQYKQGLLQQMFV